MISGGLLGQGLMGAGLLGYGVASSTPGGALTQPFDAYQPVGVSQQSPWSN